ncbi:MAG: bifunctional helix-turn-helix transcriptional regulator/GNAT family N-acetyltransferase [Bacteroidota bacterium]
MERLHTISELGYLSVGSQMRAIYERLQLEGDKVYSAVDIKFKSSWFPIYHTIAYSNRLLSVKEITQRISYSRITVKNVVKELAAERLIEISANPHDKRSKLFQLTKKGTVLKPRLEALWDSFSIELQRIFNSDKREFLEKLKDVNQSLLASSFEKRVLKNYYDFTIRNATNDEFGTIGELMVEVYSALPGFPKIEEQPSYYNMLKNVGGLTKNPKVELIVAVSKRGKLGGAVVYFHDMKDYGSGGSATQEKNACGFRLLAVASQLRGLGLGKDLTLECIKRGESSNAEQMIIHTTKAMKTAWSMYESLGFRRSEDLDFMQEQLPVFGFRREV